MIAATGGMGTVSCWPLVLVALAIMLFGLVLIKDIRSRRNKNELYRKLNNGY